MCAAVLAGCATTAGLTRLEPVAHATRGTLPVHETQLSNTEAEWVVARAIAEHEMRRP